MRAWWCRRIAIVGLGASACLPTPPPNSALGEYPEVLGLRMEVVEPGPLSQGLLPIPADRTRSEALPGDRVRLTALVASEEGVLDLEDHDPRWIMTTPFEPRPPEPDRVPPCPTDRAVTADEWRCEVGRGSTVELTIPPLRPIADSLLAEPSVTLVAGIGISTDECVDRILHDPTEVTFDCLLGRRSLRLGPAPQIMQYLLDQGLTLEELELPPDVELLDVQLPPDTAPELRYIVLQPAGSVPRADEARLVWPGERASVTAGTTYDLELVAELRDHEPYPVPWGGLGQEWLSRSIHTTVPAWIGFRLVVPEDEAELSMFVITSDNRGSQTWAIFDFEVVPP